LWKGEPLFSPTVLDGVGYTGAEGGTVTAFDTADGNELWQTELGGGNVLNVAVAGDVLYALRARNETDAVDSAIFALDAVTGEQLWSFTVDSEVLGGVAVAGGIAVVDTDYTGIFAIGGTDQGAVAATPPLSSSPATQGTTAGSMGVRQRPLRLQSAQPRRRRGEDRGHIESTMTCSTSTKTTASTS
jgi:outer membrane protein assembly factor BamB